MTSARTAAPATLRLAAASRVVAVPQMNGMDMRVATQLGSFAFFVAEGARLAIAGRGESRIREARWSLLRGECE
jgi:hypothetical protein